MSKLLTLFRRDDCTRTAKVGDELVSRVLWKASRVILREPARSVEMLTWTALTREAKRPRHTLALVHRKRRFEQKRCGTRRAFLINSLSRSRYSTENA